MTKRLTEEHKITEFFGCNVFNDKAMREYLSEDIYAKLKSAVDQGLPLDKEVASGVATGMMEWATKNGATHYTHWFQPLNGATAEKHDSFISIDKKGNTIYEFTGNNLRKGEADASSFPSGGIRATFEARGYTVWDYSSPAFIRKQENGAGILYIPTAFCSYTGETLDKKTPLLRSMNALSKSASNMLKTIGSKSTDIVVTVGGEQEYFLIDTKDYNKRDDLRLTGRTLFGAPAPKGQEMEDQYYGSIRRRVSAFMADLNEELWKLGITAKTQHNEVAPCQHELAPIYSTVNIATDQNQIIMDSMKKIAEKHNLTCLLHEKPFAGINGSGKHNNWSLNTTDGRNLLKPLKNVAFDPEFLVFFTAVISAVDEYSELVRFSASNVGNDLRLGGHEAPPAIISINIGEEMEALFESMTHNAYHYSKRAFKTGVNALAEFSLDNSDRNRTSPFAYTGNKFEFRMVGSSATLANPNTVLNTITAEMLDRMAYEIDSCKATRDLNDAVIEVVTKYYNEHKRIIFNGNNYSNDWLVEAQKRGLPNITNCVDSYECLTEERNINVFEKQGVMDRIEVLSRYDISLDNYIKTINIEARTMLTIARTQILPALMKYCGTLAQAYVAVKQISLGTSYVDIVASIDKGIKFIEDSVNELERALDNRPVNATKKELAIYYRDTIKYIMEKLRSRVDSMEKICDKDAWPLPSYAEIFFYE